MQLLHFILSLMFPVTMVINHGFNEQPGLHARVFNDEPEIRFIVGKFFSALTALNFQEARQYAHAHQDCQKVFDVLKKVSNDPDVKKNPAPTIKDIKMEKDRATVTFVETTAPMRLEKVSGKWKIHMCGKK